MTMHSMKGHSLADNLWAQLGLLAAVAVILILLASRYVWYVASEAAAIGGLVYLAAPRASSYDRGYVRNIATSKACCACLSPLLDKADLRRDPDVRFWG
jgi:hypothetical protein